jgi:hypothetical protein
MKKKTALFAGITTFIVVFLLFGGLFLLQPKYGDHTKIYKVLAPSKLLAIEADKILGSLNSKKIQITVSANESQGNTNTPAKTTKKVGIDEFIIDLETSMFVRDGVVDSLFLKKVMSHEFMHVLSLQNSQIATSSTLFQKGITIDTKAFDEKELACRPQYYNLQGCFTQSSYLSSFYRAFWAGATQEEYDRIQHIQDKTEFSTQIIQWGQQHKDMFVSQTAFTSAEEDLAESFSIWIKNENINTLGLVQQNKIHFFDAYPELQMIRTSFSKVE